MTHHSWDHQPASAVVAAAIGPARPGNDESSSSSTGTGPTMGYHPPHHQSQHGSRSNAPPEDASARAAAVMSLSQIPPYHHPSSSAPSASASASASASTSNINGNGNGTTTGANGSVAKKKPATDPFYGHEEISRTAARFIISLFACPDRPAATEPATPQPTMAHFVAYSLHRTRLPHFVTLVALLLLRRLKTRFPQARGSSGHRLFISAFMIASKVVCDDTYSNQSWCTVGQKMFTLKEMNQMEREMCGYLEWNLGAMHEEVDEFERWLLAQHSTASVLARKQQQQQAQHAAMLQVVQAQAKVQAQAVMQARMSCSPAMLAALPATAAGTPTSISPMPSPDVPATAAGPSSSASLPLSNGSEASVGRTAAHGREIAALPIRKPKPSRASSAQTYPGEVTPAWIANGGGYLPAPAVSTSLSTVSSGRTASNGLYAASFSQEALGSQGSQYEDAQTFAAQLHHRQQHQQHQQQPSQSLTRAHRSDVNIAASWEDARRSSIASAPRPSSMIAHHAQEQQQEEGSQQHQRYQHAGFEGRPSLVDDDGRRSESSSTVLAAAAATATSTWYRPSNGLLASSSSKRHSEQYSLHPDGSSPNPSLMPPSTNSSAQSSPESVPCQTPSPSVDSQLSQAAHDDNHQAPGPVAIPRTAMGSAGLAGSLHPASLGIPGHALSVSEGSDHEQEFLHRPYKLARSTSVSFPAARMQVGW